MFRCRGRYLPPTPIAMLSMVLSDVFEREGERPSAIAVAVVTAFEELLLAFPLLC